MPERNLLDGKKILIVDDETDILETLEDILTMCEVATASSFNEAEALLKTRYFDIAVLDIMGVNGYELLKIAKKKGVMSIILTAHALTPDNLMKSFNQGADSYVPKDKIADITTFLEDILEARQQGKHLWGRWFERFASFFEKKFGPEWQAENKDFLKNLQYRI